MLLNYSSQFNECWTVQGKDAVVQVITRKRIAGGITLSRPYSAGLNKAFGV